MRGLSTELFPLPSIEVTPDLVPCFYLSPPESRDLTCVGGVTILASITS